MRMANLSPAARRRRTAQARCQTILQRIYQCRAALLAVLFALWGLILLFHLEAMLAEQHSSTPARPLPTHTATVSQPQSDNPSLCDAATSEQPTPPALLPKVALMFLAPHGRVHEALWRHWLKQAARLPPDVISHSPAQTRSESAASIARTRVHHHDAYDHNKQHDPNRQHDHKLPAETACGSTGLLDAATLAALSTTLPGPLHEQLSHGPGFNLTSLTQAAGGMHPALTRWPSYPWVQLQHAPPASPCPHPPMRRQPLPTTMRWLQGWRSRAANRLRGWLCLGGGEAGLGWWCGVNGEAAWERPLLDARVEQLMGSCHGPNITTGPHTFSHDGHGRASGSGTQDCGPGPNPPGEQGPVAQPLFSVYVHTQPGMVLHNTSLFAGRQVTHPVDTEGGYAQPALMQASLVLLSEALRDPANMRFVLLSDSTIPVQPPWLVWAQLLSETRSRVDACRDMDMDSERWRPAMATPHLQLDHFRKSSQWWALSRAHAALAVADGHVKEMFARHCFSNTTHSCSTEQVKPKNRTKVSARPGLLCRLSRSCAPEHQPPNRPTTSNSSMSPLCIADEHYVPTLLATYGLDTQTDCMGMATYADWRRPTGSTHPHTFAPHELGPRLAARVRQPHDSGGGP